MRSEIVSPLFDVSHGLLLLSLGSLLSSSLTLLRVRVLLLADFRHTSSLLGVLQTKRLHDAGECTGHIHLAVVGDDLASSIREVLPATLEK